MKKILYILILTALVATSLHSAEKAVVLDNVNIKPLSPEEIAAAKKAEQLAFVSELLDNPFSNLWILLFEEKHYTAKSTVNDKTYSANQMLFQPILPFEINSNLRLVSRPTFSFYTQHNILNPDGSFQDSTNSGNSAGIGDFALISMVAPNKNEGYIWAIGPSVSTALTHNEFSSENPGIGFSIAQIYLAKKYFAGALYIQNFQINSNVNNDKRANLQYFIGYKFNEKWAISISPTATINYSAEKGQKLDLPIGIGIGRTMIVGIPLRVSLEADRYIISPDGNVKPETTLSIHIMSVIPNLIKYHDRLF